MLALVTNTALSSTTQALLINNQIPLLIINRFYSYNRRGKRNGFKHQSLSSSFLSTSTSSSNYNKHPPPEMNAPYNNEKFTAKNKTMTALTLVGVGALLTGPVKTIPMFFVGSAATALYYVVSSVSNRSAFKRRGNAPDSGQGVVSWNWHHPSRSSTGTFTRSALGETSLVSNDTYRDKKDQIWQKKVANYESIISSGRKEEFPFSQKNATLEHDNISREIQKAIEEAIEVMKEERLKENEAERRKVEEERGAKKTEQLEELMLELKALKRIIASKNKGTNSWRE